MIGTSLLAAAAAALVLGGLLLIIDGARRRPPAPPRPPKQHKVRRLRLSRGQKIGVAIAGIVGVWIAVTTGWVIAIVLLPVLTVLAPTLLAGGSAASSIKRLEAIEDWSRHLAGRLGVGSMLQSAIINSMATVKPPIEPEVRKLVARLRAQWPLDRALDAFGDDLNDAVGDQLVASLKMAAASNNSAGLQAVLADVADAIAISVSHRRMVDSEQAKVRQTARLVTLVTLVVITITGFSGFLAPYGTPVGQLALALLAGAYLGCLIWIRRASEPPAAPRLLTAGKVPS